MSLIIGLTGRAKSGKTITANAMADCAAEQGHRVEIYEYSNYILDDMKDRDLVPKDITRETVDVRLLVDHGTSMREKSTGFWTNRILADIFGLGDHVAIIPNVRFQDEALAIRRNSGVIVRVRSLVDEGIDWISPDRDPNHASEVDNLRIKADFFLQTLRGQEELMRAQARTLFRYLLKGKA